MGRNDYAEDFKSIKDRLQFLIEKGRSETRLKTPFEKTTGGAKEGEKNFMQYAMQESKDDLEMKQKSFLNEGQQINKRLERPPVRNYDSAAEDFEFFCIDIDNYVD